MQTQSAKWSAAMSAATGKDFLFQRMPKVERPRLLTQAAGAFIKSQLRSR